jgi:hypothetical protein
LSGLSFFNHGLHRRVSLLTNLFRMNFLVLFGIIFGVFALSFVLINIRHVVTGDEFRGTCASNNPMLKNKVGNCDVCGKTPEQDCKMPEMPKV